MAEDMQKKMAAALAAVNAYMQMEEQVAAQSQVETSVQQVQSCWSQSGRQDMMTMRRLIQLRTFTKNR